MKISTRATLECSIDSAWEALHTPDIFRRVSAPFTVFRTTTDSPLPDRFDTGVDYQVTVMAGGIIPLGRQVIHLSDQITDWTKRTVTDSGRGVSGALGSLRGWNHRMSLQAMPDGRTDFFDTLNVQAGVQTPLLWPALRIMWAWRAMRLRQVTKALDPAATNMWNARYAGKSAMWSGKVNPVLEQVASTLTPGQAIDAGAGEGGDAVWLAGQGWSVTALEASSVGIYRGVQAAQSAGHEIVWKVSDLAQPWPVEAKSAQLVSLQFIHTDPDTRQAIWSHAVDAVAPGGTLLIVGHDPADAEAGIPRPPAVMCFGQDDVGLIPSEWSSVNARRVPRKQTVDGREVDVHDVVIEAVR